MFKLINIKIKGILQINELSIPKGKVTCILGPSGSGKSTLLRLLNNLNSPDEGEVLFNKKPLNDFNPVELRRRVIMVPQTPIIFEGTVEDNLLIGLKFIEKEPASQNEIEGALDMVHLQKDLKQNADRLSGGEKQRLALARVILMNPEVLLLDEPSSALDEDTANLVVGRIVDYIRRTSKTLIMITHSKQIAAQFSDYQIDIEALNNCFQKGD